MHSNTTHCETDLKLCLFEQLALIGKSLGHANRLLILDILAQRDCPVETLSEKLNLSTANVSKHLQQLKQAGLVSSQVQGVQRIYALSDPNIVPMIQAMRQLAESQMEQVADILTEKLNPRAPLLPFNPKALQKAVDSQQITLLDVRPSDEYESGHIQGAINIPIHELQQKTALLNKDRPVIVYCRGPYCLWSYEAVESLTNNRFEAKRLAEGYPEWAFNKRQNSPKT